MAAVTDLNLKLIISGLAAVAIFLFWMLSIYLRKKQGKTFGLIRGKAHGGLRPIDQQWRQH